MTTASEGPPSRPTVSLRGQEPSSSRNDGSLDALADRLAEEMATAWSQGQRPLTEDFLARHPELTRAPEAAVRLIYEEVCLRQEFGAEQSLTEVVRRFPHWQAELELLLDCHLRMQGSPAVESHFPEVGETLHDLTLTRELGRGAQGRVFLATQHVLAGRPVVLKVSPCTGQEHLALARLQHTYIVPLFWMHDLAERNLRLLCMPYLGGTTLNRILTALQGRSPASCSGSDLLQALDQLQDTAGLPTDGPARQILSRASYVGALCWMGANLADALQHAHERGLVHLDLKPSNVLLAADGQPLLLDFHLARGPLEVGGPAPEWFGGTPTYMAPEQRQATEAVRHRQPIPVRVDGRADIYALGLLLYEALAGALPPVGLPVWPLHGRNPEVSVGLSDIIHKCLAVDPRERYAEAREVAADLRRHLNDQPLRGVPNRSWAERWRKWRRRRPLALPLAGMVAFILVVVLSGGGLAWDYQARHVRMARTALEEGRLDLEQQQYAAAAAALEHGLEALQGTPGSEQLAADLGASWRVARRGRLAEELHQVAEQTRFLDDGNSLPADVARALAEQCRQVWHEKQLILESQGSPLPPGLEERIKTDWCDLTLFWTDLRLRLATPQEAPAILHEALQMLAEIEGVVGSSPALEQQRQTWAEQLDDHAIAEEAARQVARLAPQTAWDHYALGRLYLHREDWTLAKLEFERALQSRPQEFWPHFYQGVCAYRLRSYSEAVAAFATCTALNPSAAPCYYNLARARSAQGDTQAALENYSQALRLDPNLSAAALNRGLLLYQEQRYQEALNELDRVGAQGANRAVVEAVRRAIEHRMKEDSRPDPSLLAHPSSR